MFSYLFFLFICLTILEVFLLANVTLECTGPDLGKRGQGACSFAGLRKIKILVTN